MGRKTPFIRASIITPAFNRSPPNAILVAHRYFANIWNFQGHYVIIKLSNVHFTFDVRASVCWFGLARIAFACALCLEFAGRFFVGVCTPQPQEAETVMHHLLFSKLH